MIINLKDVSKSYKSKYVTRSILEKCDFKINKGDLVSIIGKSGSGKSTLLNLLGIIDSSDSGIYEFDGENVSELSSNEKSNIRNTKIGFIYQNFSLIDDLSVLQNVIVPLNIRKMKKNEKIKVAREALEQVGLKDHYHKMIYELSGGERQRVAIARTIVQDTDVILADEPTGNLDSKTSGAIIDIMLELNKQGKTVIIVTHDLVISKLCTRRFELKDKKIIEIS